MDEAIPRATTVAAAGTWPEDRLRDTVTVDFDDRFRRRRLYTGEGGLAFLLDLPEAQVLKDGDGLALATGGFVRVPYNDVDAVAKAASNHAGRVVGVLVEPVQGEGGVNVPAADYLNKLRALCDQQDLLLMLDEVQTGNGRSGRWFAFQLNGITPDILATAKGLGNGFPIGATLAAGKAAGVFQPGHHGSTFGGSPLACRAALAVYEALDKEDIIGNAERQGRYLVDTLRQRLAGNGKVKEVRGLGLLIGIELHKSGKDLVPRARERGLILNVTADKVIRLVPPLTISRQEADFVIDTIVQLLQE